MRDCEIELYRKSFHKWIDKNCSKNDFTPHLWVEIARYQKLHVECGGQRAWPADLMKYAGGESLG